MSDPSVYEIGLDAIIVDPRLQPRHGMSDEAVDDYAVNFDKLPPVVVFYPGLLDDPGYWLAGGFHRIAAARKLGRKTVLAEVRTGEFLDALEFAAGDNLTHGLRRTNADKRRAVEMILAYHGEWSDRRIADLCGVSDHLVADVRSGLGGQVRVLAPGREGRDGKRYPIPTTEPPADTPPGSNDADSSAHTSTAPEMIRNDPGEVSVDEPAAEQKPPLAAEGKPAGKAPAITPPADAPIADQVGLPVSGIMGVVFAETRPQFDAVAAAVRQLGKLIDTLAKAPGGELLRRRCELTMRDGKESFRVTHLRNLLSILDASQPYAGRCPACEASGDKPKCLACHGLGWLTEDAWRAIPPELKQGKG